MSYSTHVENLYYALAAHCSPPEFDIRTVLEVYNSADYVMPVDLVEPVTTEDYLMRFPVSRQSQLRAALEKQVRDKYHYAFVKKDKLLVDGYKVPRVVLASSDETIANLGPWYMAYSRAMKKKFTKLSSPFLFGSGVTGEHVGSWFDHWSNIIGPSYYINSDFSKMDRSENVIIISWEWENYFRSMNKETREKYRCYYLDQLVVKIRGMQGSGGAVRLGGKCSGCLNTCVGNTIVHDKLLKHFLKQQGLILGRDVAYIILGDDLFLMSNKKVNFKAYNLLCTKVGFDIKLQIHKSLSKVDFCQKLFYPTNDGTMMGPKPGRFLAKIGYSFKEKDDTSSSIFSEDTHHVPILNQLPTSAIGRIWNDWELGNRKVHNPTEDTNLFFYTRYGFRPPSHISELTSEQIEIMDQIDNNRDKVTKFDTVQADAHVRFLKEGGKVVQRVKLEKVALQLYRNFSQKVGRYLHSGRCNGAQRKRLSNILRDIRLSLAR